MIYGYETLWFHKKIHFHETLIKKQVKTFETAPLLTKNYRYSTKLIQQKLKIFTLYKSGILYPDLYSIKLKN